MSTIPTFFPLLLHSPPYHYLRRTNWNLFRQPNKPLITNFTTNFLRKTSPMDSSTRLQSNVPDLGFVQTAIQLTQLSPPTWQSAIFSNLLIFLVGSPLLVTGLSISGIGAAFLLGSLTWRGFGPSGFLLVAVYFVIVSKIVKKNCTFL